MTIITKRINCIFKLPYVTDGLIALWDGEWNAGIAKHNPNANVWIDLVSGYAGAKAADAVQWLDKACALNNGYFLVDPLPAPIRTAMDADTFTWEVCRNYKSGDGHYATIDSSTIRNEFWASGPNNANSYLSWHSPSFTSYCGSGGGRAKTTHTFAIGGDTITGYSRGIAYATQTFTANGSIDATARLQLGGKRGITAGIYCIRMYSRALSAAEIAANYAIDKKRFEIEN